MARTISIKTVKASTSKPNRKPPPGDKTIGLETAIRFYEIEYGNKTKKLEESEIFFINDSILMASNQNLVKRRFPFINMFNHKGPYVISAMRYLTVGVFEHIDITSILDIDIKIKYTEGILRGPEPKEFDRSC